MFSLLRRVAVTVAFVFAVLGMVVGGVVALGPSLNDGYTPTYTDEEPPQRCVASDVRPGSTSLPGDDRPNETASVVATYHRVPNSSAYRVTYDIPAEWTDPIRVTPAADRLRVTDRRGFRRAVGDSYTWNRETLNASITVEPTADGKIDFTQTHGRSWLLAPSLRHQGSNVTVRPAADGAIGSQFLYLGALTVHRNTVGCQEHVLVLPENADSVSPETVLSRLDESARRLNVGGADETVRMFVSPVDTDGRFSGLAGDEEFIVTQRQRPLSTIWIHEYVHTRQQFRAVDDFQWFTEGSATYLADRLALEQGIISPRAYDAKLSLQARLPAGTSLSRADRESKYSYWWGRAVLSQLELAVSGSNASVGDLVRTLNEQGDAGKAHVDSRDAEQWVDDALARPGSDGRYRFAAAVEATANPEPGYLLGPSWLTPRMRLWLGQLSTGTGRLLAFGVFVVSTLSVAVKLRSVAGSLRDA